MWALDYQFDVTATGRTIKILHVVDEFTPESLADVVDPRSTLTPPWPPLDKVVGTRGTNPEFVGCDNDRRSPANALRGWTDDQRSGQRR